jgi:hypothetical protein
MTSPSQLLQFADVHALPVRRYFNVLCMAYGEDPNLFADAITDWHLPQVRARNCKYEYLRFQYAYRTLIHPYLDWELCEKIKLANLLDFAPETENLYP